jgi:divalent metal cation (Fe/Co/Zn/Cd) transporter
LLRRARLLAWATIAYNTAEGVVAVLAGLAAGSVALVSFGLDSGVEVLSAVAVSWQFSGRMDPELRERRTLRFIAVSFFALAAYVTVDAVRALLAGNDPEPSHVGVYLAVASLIVMPVLTHAKRRVGRELGSATVTADATQTLLCTYLSAVLLGGLLLNDRLGWGWADPVAALVIAGVAVREGLEAWRGDACCEPAPTGSGQATESGDADGCSDGCCTIEAAGIRQSKLSEAPSRRSARKMWPTRALGTDEQ